MAENTDYTPTCPYGYTDCIWDPAYIHCYHSDWYREIYGNKSIEEVSSECREMYDKCDNKEYCYQYDNEDK